MSTSTQGEDVTEVSATAPVEATEPEVALTATHRVPDDGMPWWGEPDPERDADGRLDPRLPVEVLEETTGWAHVRCANAFECWVDAARLLEVEPATAPAPLEPTEVTDATDATDATDETQLVETAPSPASMGRAARVSIALSLAGALLAIVGGALPWYSARGVDVTAWDLRVVALFTRESTDVSLEVGPLLVVTALTALALVLRRPLPAWASLALAGVPLVLGVAGIAFFLDLPGSSTDLGIGLVITLLGGVVMLAGLAVSPRMLPRPLVRLR
jgi:hypothetical protein